MDLTYQRESYPELGPAEFIDLLVRFTLAERRPVDQPETIRGMLEHAAIIVTARAGGRLVGISRAITDFNFCTYLSDLAVDTEFQRRGNRQGADPPDPRGGRPGHDLDPAGRPLARNYYPHIGMQFHDSCWIIPRQG